MNIGKDWYSDKTKELKRKLHEIKYEYNFEYRYTYDLFQKVKTSINSSSWSGMTTSNHLKYYDGFINQIH